MKRYLYVFLLIALGFVAGRYSLYLYATPQNHDLRNNGVDWFQCGPALLPNGNCNSISVRLGPGKTSVITDKVQIAKLEKWITDNKITQSINYSPLWPHLDLGDTIPAYSLDLSASTNPNDENSSIIYIPLSPMTMGISDTDFQGKVTELENLVEAMRH
jgi:hypothetical protein